MTTTPNATKARTGTTQVSLLPEQRAVIAMRNKLESNERRMNEMRVERDALRSFVIKLSQEVDLVDETLLAEARKVLNDTLV